MLRIVYTELVPTLVGYNLDIGYGQFVTIIVIEHVLVFRTIEIDLIALAMEYEIMALQEQLAARRGSNVYDFSTGQRLAI